MAHFAEIDNDNVVLRVVVVDDEHEDRGNDYLSLDLKLGGKWIQTSYNNSIRYNFAGIGFKYDVDRDAFIPPRPPEMLSWTLNEDTCMYEPPLEYPEDGKSYRWDEDSVSWIEDS